MDNRPIAVFDSGVGSLSVVRSLRREMPDESILYLADRAHYPYGKKTKEQLKSIIIQTFKYLEKFDPKLIIVASVTPSMHVLRECKLYTSIPVSGVYLNIADALALSKTRCIALLATEGTLKSEALDDYIKPYITVASIVKIDASPLIDLVESGKFLEDDSSVKEAITKNTALLKSNQKVDVMILGSTHLALLKKQLADLYPSIQLIDPAMKTLERVKTYLQNHSMTALENAGLKILVSKNREQFEKIARKFGLQEPVEEVTLDFKVDAF